MSRERERVKNARAFAIDGEVLRDDVSEIGFSLRAGWRLRIDWLDKHGINYNSALLLPLMVRKNSRNGTRVFAVSLDNYSIASNRRRGVLAECHSRARAREREGESQGRRGREDEKCSKNERTYERTNGRKLTSHYRPTDVCIPLAVAYARIVTRLSRPRRSLSPFPTTLRQVHGIVSRCPSRIL